MSLAKEGTSQQYKWITDMSE